MLFPYWLPVLLYMIWSLITIYVLSIVWVLWGGYIPQFHGNYSETVLLSVDKHAIFRTCFICNSTSLSYELIWRLCLWVCANTLPCFILLKPMKDISNFSEFIKRFKFQSRRYLYVIFNLWPEFWPVKVENRKLILLDRHIVRFF